MNDEISSLRQRGIVWLTMAGWTVSGAFVLMALFTGTYGWQALIASVAINLPPSWRCRNAMMQPPGWLSV